MIEVNPDYDKGEFDVLFKDGKMYIQDYETNVTAKEVGTVKTDGMGEGGGVVFEVDDWKSDPKIWPHDKLFGVTKVSHGESNTFNFLEMAWSDKSIKELDEGLKGRYFVGIECFDKKVCDFSKATPDHPKSLFSGMYAKYKFFMG
jgi:hypothetical protein